MQLFIGKLHIQINWYYGYDRKKYMRLYNKRVMDKRADRGLCRQCGKKVTKINPHTGQFYRNCEKHRKAENNTSKKRRDAKAANRYVDGRKF